MKTLFLILIIACLFNSNTTLVAYTNGNEHCSRNFNSQKFKLGESGCRLDCQCRGEGTVCLRDDTPYYRKKKDGNISFGIGRNLCKLTEEGCAGFGKVKIVGARGERCVDHKLVEIAKKNHVAHLLDQLINPLDKVKEDLEDAELEKAKNTFAKGLSDLSQQTMKKYNIKK